jgi:hypothetical protein
VPTRRIAYKRLFQAALDAPLDRVTACLRWAGVPVGGLSHVKRPPPEVWHHEWEVRHPLDRMSPAQLKTFLEGRDEGRGTMRPPAVTASPHGLKGPIPPILFERSARQNDVGRQLRRDYVRHPIAEVRQIDVLEQGLASAQNDG